MSAVKHKIEIGAFEEVAFDGFTTEFTIPSITFDSKVITFDSEEITFDAI